MKIETLQQRLSKNRPTTSVTINIPEDVIEDLKRIAPKLGFSNYQSLIRAYIGQGLRVDLERLENDPVTALIALALLDASPKVSSLRQEVQKFRISQASVDETEEGLMYDSAIQYQKRFAQDRIEPVRKQINLKKSLQENDLLPIVTDSYFVPEERKYLFAKGLYAGLIGDFVTSTHLLIPQIENSIRCLVEKPDVITYKLDDIQFDIQEEHNLNNTLERPEIISIFDENTLFNLKSLLFGSNLKHRMARGLINDSEFSSSLMSYLWWLTLRLCCLLSSNYQQKLENSDPWVRFAGIFKDDPIFDEFVEDMAAYRGEINAELTEDEVTYEESQST